jgi:hypothetical protein
MHWRDRSATGSYLEVEDKYGYDHILASVHLQWGEWIAERRNGSVIGRFATEEEAKAVTLVTIRMEQADGTKPETLTPYAILSRVRRR